MDGWTHWWNQSPHWLSYFLIIDPVTGSQTFHTRKGHMWSILHIQTITNISRFLSWPCGPQILSNVSHMVHYKRQRWIYHSHCLRRSYVLCSLLQTCMSFHPPSQVGRMSDISVSTPPSLAAFSPWYSIRNFVNMFALILKPCYTASENAGNASQGGPCLIWTPHI